MKKISLILLAFVLFAGMVNAQSEATKKGTFVLNPQLLNLSFSSLSLKGDADVKLSQLGFAFSGGYAVMDGLIINGQLGYQHLKLEDNKVSLFSIGAGSRYYFPNNFFGGVGLLYNHGKIKGADTEDSAELSAGFLDLRAEAGYAWFITPSVALEPSVSYGMKLAGGKIDEMDAEIDYNRFGVNLGFSVFF